MAAGCFIAGTSLSSLVFGNVIHHFTNSLRPLAIATLLWASAAVVTGVSRTLLVTAANKNYFRALSRPFQLCCTHVHRRQDSTGNYSHLCLALFELR